MHLLILSRSTALYSTDRLTLAARARGHQVTVVDPMELQLVLQRDALSLRWHAHPLPEVDLVLPRIGSSAPEYALTVLRQIALGGVPVLNAVDAIARARDKLHTLQCLASAQLDIPKTLCLSSLHALEEGLQFLGGFPVVVKLKQGSQGVGTMLAESRKSLLPLLETMWGMGQEVLLQEFVASARGSDLRAFVVGDSVVASMRRRAKRGDFRSNLHCGGVGQKVALPPLYRETALRAARILGLAVAGVDMLEGIDGPKVLEVNSSPGLEGIERTTGVDVAEAIVEYAEQWVGEPHRDQAEFLSG